MKWKHVSVVFAKEMKDALRDKRTMVGLIIIPVLMMPLLLLGIPLFMQNRMDRVDEQPARLALIGAEHAPDFVEFLRASPTLIIIEELAEEPGGPRDGVDVVLSIPVGFSDSLALEEHAALGVRFDASVERSVAAQRRVVGVVGQYADLIVAERLAALGISVNLLQPFELIAVNVAPEEQMGNLALSLVLPIVIAMWASLGGMYTAIDVAAGEKERGTLEPLLATPPQRASLVVGKYLAVVATSMFSASLALASLILSIAAIPRALVLEAEGQIMYMMSPATILLIFLAALLLSMFFAVVALILSFFARSFKEAQVYLSPLSFLVIVPTFFIQFTVVGEAPFGYFILPIVNSLLLMKGALLGGLTLNSVMLATLASFIICCVGLVFIVRLFQSENVLFRS